MLAVQQVGECAHFDIALVIAGADAVKLAGSGSDPVPEPKNPATD